jgi:plasmid stabilization system protein ParE
MIVARVEAHYDIISAMAHYARKDPALAHHFLDTIEEKINHITQFPQSYPFKVKNQYRRTVLSRYLYSIYYKIESDNTIVITAVLSNNIDPKIILKKV